MLTRLERMIDEEKTTMTEVTTWFTATLEKVAKGEVLKRLVQSGKKTIVRKVVLT